MAEYQYRCACNVILKPFPMGEAPRTVQCPRCGDRMKLVIGAGVQVAPVKAAGISDTALSDDLAAYRRMRGRGIEPDSPIGAARLENEVEDNFDIKHRDLYQYASKETIKDAVEETKQYELGLL